jgi:predicted ATPase
MHINSLSLIPENYPTKEHYPFDNKLFQQTRYLEFKTPVTFFVGENGCGKSTLLEALSRKCGIHMWNNIERVSYRLNRYEKLLHRYMDIDWANGPVPGSFFGSDTFKTFAECLDEWASSDPGLLKYFGGKSLMEQSHGQSLMSFFTSRYKIKGLYLLDEPETALSPKTELKLLKLIEETSRAGHAQFIIASHSPILLSCPGATIYNFEHAPVEEVFYEDTEHFQVYRDFILGKVQSVEEVI